MLKWHFSAHESVAAIAYYMWECEGKPEGEDKRHWYEALSDYGTFGHSWKVTNYIYIVTITHCGSREFLLQFPGLQEERYSTWKEAEKRAQDLVNQEEHLIIDRRYRSPRQMVEDKFMAKMQGDRYEKSFTTCQPHRFRK